MTEYESLYLTQLQLVILNGFFVVVVVVVFVYIYLLLVSLLLSLSFRKGRPETPR